MQFSCIPLFSYLYCKKIRPTSAIQNEVTTITERWSNPNAQSIFIPTFYYLNCYVVQGWCTWSCMSNGLSLLIYQWGTITKCSQFFLYALQPDNKPPSYGHSSFNRNLLLSVYRVSQEESARFRESVPYVKLYRYNPKHLYPKLNGYGDNGQRSLKLWQLLHTYWLPNTY